MSIKRFVQGSPIRGWLIVMAAAAVGAVIGGFLTFGSNAVYTANTTMYVTPPISSTPTDAVLADQYAMNRADLYLELISSDELARQVAALLGTSESPGALASRISATNLHETPILVIEAQGASADDARSLANAYIEALPVYAKSVERNSGLREDEPLEPVVLPIAVTSSKSGMTPYLRTLLWMAVFSVPALLFVLWNRYRHPVVRDPRRIRDACQVPFVEEVGDDPHQLSRIQAFVLAAPRSPRLLLLVSPRKADTLDEFTTEFVEQLHSADVACERLRGPQLDDLSTGAHANSLAIVEAPGVLDDPPRLDAIANRPVTAVIVVRRGRTLLEDVVELRSYLELIDVSDVRGVVVYRPSRRNRGTASKPVAVESVEHEGDRPWPAIDVLENELRGKASGGPRR